MTTFDDREQAFENRYAHDEDLRFRAQARGNRKLGFWAAALMGRDQAQAEAYAESLVATAVEGGGERSVLERVRNDLRAAGVDRTDAQVRSEEERLLAEAVAELMAG